MQKVKADKKYTLEISVKNDKYFPIQMPIIKNITSRIIG